MLDAAAGLLTLAVLLVLLGVGLWVPFALVGVSVTALAWVPYRRDGRGGVAPA